MWCVYSGKQIKKSESNKEHVLPLSLGGDNRFIINVGKKVNSEVGSSLDGWFGSLPLVTMARKFYRLNGHSGKKPINVEWAAKFQETKGRVDFSGADIVFKTRRSWNEYGLNCDGDAKKKTFQSQQAYDLDLMLSFASKIALGTGLFLYGQDFRDQGFHENLRQLMNADKSTKELPMIMMKNSSFWALNWPVSETPTLPLWCRAVSSQKDKNLIFTCYEARGLILCVSLFSGFWKWFFSIMPATYSGIDFGELGTVMEFDLISRKMNRSGLRTYLNKYRQKLY